MGIVSKAAGYIERGEVEIIAYGDKILVEVQDKQVIFRKRAGRTEVSCSCENHARFCRSPVICAHKLAACTIITLRKIKW